MNVANYENQFLFLFRPRFRPLKDNLRSSPAKWFTHNWAFKYKCYRFYHCFFIIGAQNVSNYRAQNSHTGPSYLLPALLKFVTVSGQCLSNAS